MRKKPKMTGVVCTVALAVALTTLGFAGSASAKLTGEYTKFQFCPYTNPSVLKCLNSLTTGGEVVLGKKKVPIEKQVTLQGGVSEAVEEKGGEFSKFFAATNGVTLSKAPQSVPGGLLGIVPPESSPPLVKALSKFFFENSLTGVNSTLELAKSASDIIVSEGHLAEGEGVALEMPVKAHLENPFLGKSCFVGSSGSPLLWKLTTGTTNPPKPNGPISGQIGSFEFLDGGRILKITGAKLVDNAWSAPAASGCGGILSFLVNPIINAQIGLPSAAGNNAAILENTISVATASAVKLNNEDNP